MAWWAVRLIRFELHLRYRLLTIYLAWTAAITVLGAGLIFSGNIAGYRGLYFIYRAADWALSLAVLLELFRLTLELSPALAKAGRLFANAATAIAMLMGAGLAGGGSTGKIGMTRWFVFERSFYIAIIALSVLLLAFAVVFRVRERRNVVVLAGLLALMFSIVAIVWLARDPAEMALVHDVLLAVTMTVTLLAGIVMVKPAGEAVPEQLAPPDLRAREQEIMAQLEKTTGQLKRDATKGLEDPPSGD